MTKPKRDTIIANLKRQIEELQEQLRRQRKARIELEELLAQERMAYADYQQKQAHRWNGVGR